MSATDVLKLVGSCDVVSSEPAVGQFAANVSEALLVVDLVCLVHEGRPLSVFAVVVWISVAPAAAFVVEPTFDETVVVILTLLPTSSVGRTAKVVSTESSVCLMARMDASNELV